MKAKDLKILSLVILHAALMPPLLEAQPFPADKIIDTVRCKSAASQSYALYLPANYDSKKSWPVILIFDPGARGNMGVTAFAEAGRKYGFILACSNNSHNGPVADNFTAAAAMLMDLTERFSTDPKRIFAAGFSGGSRFALSLAAKDKRIAGVIGCGAGLPNDRNYYPSRTSDFLYYGLAGTRDMNYIELHELPALLNSQTAIISYFRSFEGGHEWPSPALLTGAVEWLILQSMNRKVLPADQAFITGAENKTRALIEAQLAAGSAYDAAMLMSFASRDFRGTAFGNKMSQLQSATEKAEPYQKDLRKWNKMVETEEKKKEKYMNYLVQTVGSGSMPDSAASWWMNETRSLVWLRDKGNPDNSRMASRILNFISILCSEQGSSYYRNRYFAQAAVFFGICTLSDSENMNNYFNLAKTQAMAGKIPEALDALNGAVKHGFNSRKTLESDPAFAALKNEKKYKEIYSKLK